MVRRIAQWHNMGEIPEEIARKFGRLSLAQFHAALAYYQCQPSGNRRRPGGRGAGNRGPRSTTPALTFTLEPAQNRPGRGRLGRRSRRGSSVSRRRVDHSLGCRPDREIRRGTISLRSLTSISRPGGEPDSRHQVRKLQDHGAKRLQARTRAKRGSFGLNESM